MTPRHSPSDVVQRGGRWHRILTAVLIGDRTMGDLHRASRSWGQDRTAKSEKAKTLAAIAALIKLDLLVRDGRFFLLTDAGAEALAGIKDAAA